MVAVTVKVDEVPTAIDIGLAVIATVGAGDILRMLPPAHPANSRLSHRPGATRREVRRIPA